MNNPLRYVDPTGEDWWNPLPWGADVGAAIGSAAVAVGNWWASPSIGDKIDAATHPFRILVAFTLGRRTRGGIAGMLRVLRAL